MSTLGQWCQDQLTSLGCDVSEDLVRHLISMDSSKEIKGYLSDMLDIANPVHQEFIENFILKWKYGTEGNLVAYKKPGKNMEPNLSTKNSKRRVKDNRQTEVTDGELYKVQQSKENEDASCSKSQTFQSSAKKKNKFTSLYGGSAKDVLTFPGRQPCICQASKHSLINNCLHCGRVVCQQEGSGPCFTCGNLVCTKAEQEMLASHSKQSEILLQKLTGMANGNCETQPYKGNLDIRGDLEKAIEHKNKLLEYDRTAEKRTRVIDDEADYFSADALKWLSPIQQKKLKEKEEEIIAKKHASRRNKRYTLDFAGRHITEEYDEPDFEFSLEHMNSISNATLWDHEKGNINPNISVEPPQYESEENGRRAKRVTALWDENILNKMRIQDGELQLMSDDGFCLSVQQPWASLLISGIKLHEGRSWYTPYRGRLWIHAGAKVPTRQEIAEAENSVKVISGNNYIKFPDQYPTGCLLGCVDVVDCLPQEEYRLQYPDGESGSPYVFICKNPQELVIKFPLKGKLKIFKMDPKYHQSAKKTLKKVLDVEK